MNNRFWNAKNPNQGEFHKVLCVCSAGLLRSPTVAWILSNEPFNCNTRAVGSNKNFALVHADDALIHWADTIVFVNMENFDEVNFAHSEALQEKNLIVLNLPDEFMFRDSKLVQIATNQLQIKFKDLELI